MKVFNEGKDSYVKGLLKLLKIIIAIVLILVIHHYGSLIDWQSMEWEQSTYALIKLLIYSAYGFIAGILIFDSPCSKEKRSKIGGIIGFIFVLILAFWDVLFAVFAVIPFAPEFMYRYCVGATMPFQFILGFWLAIIIKNMIDNRKISLIQIE